MMFFAMAFSLPVVWFLPWWSVALSSFASGFWFGPKHACPFALGSALVWPALAFLKDGRNSGIISQRMSALFSLPSPGLLFVALFVLALVTAYLGFQAGWAVRVLSKSKTV